MRGAIIKRQGMAGMEQGTSHGKSHIAKSNKANSHCLTSFFNGYGSILF
jgi:hypothetical protein